MFLEKKMPSEELDRTIKTLEKNTRVLKRLYFIRNRYGGDSVEEAADKVGVYKMVAYQCQKRWNDECYEGLIPRLAGGKHSKLSRESMEELKDTLMKMDDWTTEDVLKLVKDSFNVTFSLKHIRTILRKMGMHYSKPYQHDHRRPKNAEDDLKKN